MLRISALYVATVLIWGSTWLVITFQYGVVDPLYSVGYRFLLAAALIFAFLWWRGDRLKVPKTHQAWMALQGLFLFALNYWLFYLAEQWVISGLVAVIFSLVIYMNSLNGRWMMAKPLQARVWSGGCLGIAGLLLIFYPQLHTENSGADWWLGVALAILATYSASVGNVISARNQGQNYPFLLNMAYSMLFGALLVFGLGFILGKPVTFDVSFQYFWSLIYLAVFGSILAFGAYLKLIHELGADKAAFSSLLIPVVALMFSAGFEGYSWPLEAILGLLLLLVGNFWALRATPSVSKGNLE